MPEELKEVQCLRCSRSDRGIYSRGLCNSCYQYCRQKIAAGKISWAVLVQNGWALERSSQGRPASDAEMLAEARIKNAPKELENLPTILIECQAEGCGYSTTDSLEGIGHHDATGHDMRYRDATVVQTFHDVLSTGN